MDISLIWAMTENRVIGRDNDLPWNMPKDMRHFMNTTVGKPVIMGRKNFQSMPRALPKRTNIVMTRDRSWHAVGAEVVYDMASALNRAREVARADKVDEIMIAGGADIYRLALPIATKLYITTIHATLEGDVYFPEFDLDQWQVVEQERYPADEQHFADFTIATYRFKATSLETSPQTSPQS